MNSSVAIHYLAFRLVDQQSRAIEDRRRYTLTWTDTGATRPTVREGTTGRDGRTVQIETRGAVPVTLAIAPPSGGECRPVARSVTSKPDTRHPVVTVRLTFNATATTAPQAQDHCETLTLRAGQQQVKYIINNVPTVMNGGRSYQSYLRNFPYLIVDADTLEVLGSGNTRDQPARFSGSRHQVETAATPVDGVKSVGIVLGGAANDDPQRWRENRDTLVMYRVVPASEGLTTVTITELAEIGARLEAGEPLTGTTAASTRRHTGTLNGRVWRTFTQRYTMPDIRAWITGCLTLDTPDGTATHYQITQPSEPQIAWAERHGQISQRQATAYRYALRHGLTPLSSEERRQWEQIPIGIRQREAPPPLWLELPWADLLEPIYTGQFEKITDPSRRRSKGGDIVIPPLGLTLHFQPGFSDNAEEFAVEGQENVLAHNHPYVYMMLLDACAQSGATDVTIVGSWRPMLGSILHKLGDALDITLVDSSHDELAAFAFSGGHVRNNALANRFNTLLYNHRYARSAQHIYYGDDYPHGADGSHRNHLHITCNSRVSLEARDTAGYVGTADNGHHAPWPTSPNDGGAHDLLLDWNQWFEASGLPGGLSHGP